MTAFRLELLRFLFAPLVTIGSLRVEGVHRCFVLEDTVRPEGAPKVFGQTAIPFGDYRVDMRTVSPKFSKLAGHDVIIPRLLEVPNFSGILMHTGVNVDHTDGCLIVGRNVLAQGPGGFIVTESRPAYDELFRELERVDKEGREIWLKVARAAAA